MVFFLPEIHHSCKTILNFKSIWVINLDSLIQISFDIGSLKVEGLIELSNSLRSRKQLIRLDQYFKLYLYILQLIIVQQLYKFPIKVLNQILNQTQIYQEGTTIILHKSRKKTQKFTIGTQTLMKFHFEPNKMKK